MDTFSVLGRVYSRTGESVLTAAMAAMCATTSSSLVRSFSLKETPLNRVYVRLSDGEAWMPVALRSP